MLPGTKGSIFQSSPEPASAGKAVETSFKRAVIQLYPVAVTCTIGTIHFCQQIISSCVWNSKWNDYNICNRIGRCSLRTAYTLYHYIFSIGSCGVCCCLPVGTYSTAFCLKPYLDSIFFIGKSWFP